MSWLFSQALAEEYFPETCLGGEQFAPSKSMLTAQAYLWPGKMMGFSRLSRYGMTCAHLTENHGAALLMLFLADFRAKTSVSQEKEKESIQKEVDYGEKWRGSLGKYDHPSHSWKIHQCSLIEGLETFSEAFAKSGTMRNGEYFPLAHLVHHIHEKECSLWPTPMRSDYKGPQKNTFKTKNGSWIVRRKSGEYGAKLTDALGGKPNPMWSEWLMGWPLNWTELRPLEMDKFHAWRLSLGIL